MDIHQISPRKAAPHLTCNPRETTRNSGNASGQEVVKADDEVNIHSLAAAKGENCYGMEAVVREVDLRRAINGGFGGPALYSVTWSR